jgi:hypothetical protein
MSRFNMSYHQAMHFPLIQAFAFVAWNTENCGYPMRRVNDGYISQESWQRGQRTQK